MEDNTQLTFSDLALVKQLIDVACRRGAFEASEMRSVGEVYEKISAFIDQAISDANTKESDPTSSDQGE